MKLSYADFSIKLTDEDAHDSLTTIKTFKGSMNTFENTQ